MALKTSHAMRSLTPLALALLLAGCGDPPGSAQPETDQIVPARGGEATAEGQGTAPATVPAATDTGHAAAEDAGQAPADAFLARLAQHCGEAFEGRIVTNEPAQDGDAFEGQRLVMHVRECHDDRLLVPFHVGDNHSRTWILTRTADGLRLKHDHRVEDGSDDPMTMYGGESQQPGTAMRQEFPVDQESIDLFNSLDAQVSTQNTWAMEVEPGERFLYELSRPSGRLFRVEFDLANPVQTPPVPWGYEDEA